MAVNFGTELQRLAGGMRGTGTGMQDRPTVAQACHTTAIEQVGINAGNLRCAVGAQPHHAARELVNQFERLQI